MGVKICSGFRSDSFIFCFYMKLVDTSLLDTLFKIKEECRFDTYLPSASLAVLAEDNEGNGCFNVFLTFYWKKRVCFHGGTRK